MRLIITGAAGAIGTQAVEELSGDHELCLIDRLPVPGHASIRADLSGCPSLPGLRRWWRASSQPSWTDAFSDGHVVLHLALDQRPAYSDGELLFTNLQMTRNVIEVAARHRVRCIVFASSNWAVKGYEHELAPSCYQPRGPKIGSDAPPRPITSYGVTKAIGEISGRMAVDSGQLEAFIAVRIGSFLPSPPRDDRRHRWIGIQDMRSLLRRCVEAKITGFHAVYAVSAQSSAPYDLAHTRRILGWQPRQQQ